jgi:multiple sugar transport system permease protein
VFAPMVEPRSRRWAWAAAALAASIVFLLPLVFLVSGSLRVPGRPPPRAPQLLPDSFAWSNYERAAELVGLGGAALNSAIVAALFVPLSVLVASWAGLALVFVRARVRTVVLALSVGALMVPLTALLVPRFAVFQWLGLVDSFGPLLAPALLGASPFYVLIYFVAFRRLPTELYDACRLEGVTPLQIWRRVAMPLVRPVTVAVAVLAFVFSWGNFLDPLIYLYDRDLFTLPLALKSLAQLDPTNYPLLLAGAVVATAPVVAGFLLAQRYLFEPHRRAGWLGR